MITVKRTACKKYQITGTDEHEGQDYSITDTAGTTVTSGTLTGTQSVTFAEEGVYILIVNDEKWTIIEECELVTCLLALMTKLFCNQSGNCSECDSEEMNAIRHELNKMIAGYGLYLMWVFHERVTYYGILEIDECRLQKLQMIDQWIDDLKEIKKRCGPDDCSGTNTSTDTDCSSC